MSQSVPELARSPAAARRDLTKPVGALALGLAAAVLLMLVGLYLPQAPAAVVAVGALALLVRLVNRRPYWFVLGLIVWMPFEPILLKLLPLGRSGVIVMQFAAEFATYLALGMLVLGRLQRGEPWRRTPLDVPLLVFVVIAMVSVLVNRPPLLGSALNVRSLLRYAAVFYLVAQLDVSPRQGRTLLRLVLVVGAAQWLAGLAQWVGGTPVKQLMLPAQVDLQVGGVSRGLIMLDRGREIGSVFGTFEDTIYFGLFLLVVLCVVLGRLGRLRLWHLLPVGLLLGGIAYSYSRAALVGAVFVVIVYLWARGGLRWLLAAGATALAAALLVLVVGTFVNQGYQHPRKTEQSVLANMTGFLSLDYFERAKKQRLGSLLGVAPTALLSAPAVGYGPNELHTIDRLNHAAPSYLYKQLDKGGFEDVYWVALLSYYGLLGTAAFAWVLWRMGHLGGTLMHTAADPATRWAAGATLLLVASAPVLMLFMRVPEFRIYSFFLWLLPGVTLALAARRQPPLSSGSAS